MQYPLAIDTWTSSAIIEIKSQCGQPIGFFPLDFVRAGGDNRWTYILDVISLLIKDTHGGWLQNADEERVDTSVEPEAGVYVFCRADGQSGVKYARGPEYRELFAPAKIDEVTTISGSSRVSNRSLQSKFREALIGRDGWCLLSQEDYDGCTACHIVPQSRPDVYDSIIGRRTSIFNASSGILLRNDLHHRFDKLEFSFYCKDGAYFVHAFLGSAREYHGKRLPPEFFRSSQDKLPDPRLLRWHYRQCVLAAIRGFAHMTRSPVSSQDAINLMQRRDLADADEERSVPLGHALDAATGASAATKDWVEGNSRRGDEQAATAEDGVSRVHTQQEPMLLQGSRAKGRGNRGRGRGRRGQGRKPGGGGGDGHGSGSSGGNSDGSGKSAKSAGQQATPRASRSQIGK